MANMMNFKMKNNNRRSARKSALDNGVKRSTLNAARTERRRLGGAFGSEGDERFNFLVIGTTGTERAAKNTKEDK